MRIDAVTKGQQAAKNYDVSAEHYTRKLQPFMRQKKIKKFSHGRSTATLPHTQTPGMKFTG